MSNILGAQGVYPTLRGQPSTIFALQAGAMRLIPSGTWNIGLGPFSCIQQYDAVQGQWQTIGGESSVLHYINSDGVNYRVANLVGCVVGGMVTTAGTLYLASAPPTITLTAGAAVATAVIGGAVSTSVTVTNGGTNYLYPPLIFIDPPNYGLGSGLAATGYATLSGTTLSTITIDNQGAGYTYVPMIYVIPDPRDATGAGATAVATLTGAGTLTGILITNPGTPLATLPTFTITATTGSGAVATAIMVRTISAYTVSIAGSGYSGTVVISAVGNGISGSPSLTNPKYTTNLVRTRAATIIGVLSSGALTASGQTVLDGGIYAGSSPTATILAGIAGTGTFTAGSVGFTWAVPTTPDDCYIYPV